MRTGERFHQEYNLEFSPIVLGGEAYEVLAPGGVNVAVDRVAGGFLVDVSLAANIYGPCERCLKEVIVTVEASEQEFVPTAKDGWEASELSVFVEDFVVDVPGMAREAVVLALPAQLVCAPACKGLCSRCGHDLNEGPCACGPVETDERWSKLKDLDLGGDGRS